MKTKQEQIEEMRREIENGFQKADCREAYTNKPYPYFETQKIAIAETLYNAGYCKVPEHAVIIPAEEREEEIKATNEILAERDGLKAEIERLEAEIKYKTEVIRNAVKINEAGENELVKVRKETAKEILKDLYFNLQSSVKGHIAKSNDYYNDYYNVMGRIQEIAKNYGVEIEE